MYAQWEPENHSVSSYALYTNSDLFSVIGVHTSLYEDVCFVVFSSFFSLSIPRNRVTNTSSGKESTTQGDKTIRKWKATVSGITYITARGSELAMRGNIRGNARGDKTSGAEGGEAGLEISKSGRTLLLWSRFERTFPFEGGEGENLKNPNVRRILFVHDSSIRCCGTIYAYV